MFPRGCAGDEADRASEVHGWSGVGWGEEGRWEALPSSASVCPAAWAPAPLVLGSVIRSPGAPCSLGGEGSCFSLGRGVWRCVLAELQMGVGVHSPTHWALIEHLLRAS